MDDFGYACEGCQEEWEEVDDTYNCNDCHVAICDSCRHGFWTTCCEKCGDKLENKEKSI